MMVMIMFSFLFLSHASLCFLASNKIKRAGFFETCNLDAAHKSSRCFMLCDHHPIFIIHPFELIIIVNRMAKGASKRIIIKLLSTAGTGFYYTTRKNPINTPAKLKLMKYDPIVRKHVLFTETKMPSGKKR